jgi:putative hemolysin
MDALAQATARRLQSNRTYPRVASSGPGRGAGSATSGRWSPPNRWLLQSPEEHAIASEILVILVLVLVNGVLAGAEIAVVALRRTRIRELVERGSGAARAVQTLRERPERFLATVQIGITVVGATAGAFGGATFAEDLEPLVEAVPWLAPQAREISIGLVVSLVSYLSLVLGELVPKSLALKASERYALLIGRPLVWLSSAARPLVWFLTQSSNAVLKLFGDRTSFMEGRLSSEELQELVDEATRAGTVHPDAAEIASRALEFQELVAADVMVPRSQVVALRRDATPDEIRALLLEKTHSRFPVYAGDVDHVVGYIHMKDVLAIAWEEKLFVLEDLLRPAHFVPDSKKAVELLAEMRGQRVPLVVVVDERGSMAGIVTLEDLLEELVGEIFSEHAPHAPERFRREPDGSVVVLGTVAVRDVNRELGFALPDDGEWTTLAGLCLALAGRIPRAGDQVTTHNGFRLEVVDASPRRVRAVRVRPPATSHSE